MTPPARQSLTPPSKITLPKIQISPESGVASSEDSSRPSPHSSLSPSRIPSRKNSSQTSQSQAINDDLRKLESRLERFVGKSSEGSECSDNSDQSGNDVQFKNIWFKTICQVEVESMELLQSRVVFINQEPRAPEPRLQTRVAAPHPRRKQQPCSRTLWGRWLASPLEPRRKMMMTTLPSLLYQTLQTSLDQEEPSLGSLVSPRVRVLDLRSPGASHSRNQQLLDHHHQVDQDQGQWTVSIPDTREIVLPGTMSTLHPWEEPRSSINNNRVRRKLTMTVELQVRY